MFADESEAEEEEVSVGKKPAAAPNSVLKRPSAATQGKTDDEPASKKRPAAADAEDF